MDTQTTGECMVCGREAKHRCSACRKAGIDLFFCSSEHQRLVWPGHRIFCGSNAFPIIFPLLSPVEAEEIIASFHVMDHPAASVTRLEILKARLGRRELSEREVVDLIHWSQPPRQSPTSTRPRRCGRPSSSILASPATPARPRFATTFLALWQIFTGPSSPRASFQPTSRANWTRTLRRLSTTSSASTRSTPFAQDVQYILRRTFTLRSHWLIASSA
ncbi:RHTO0S21e02366g1_1 [Rhodotorula toruloides]|uniref:RHTO0S21e02366g1_1 n=1 Tax=Rhodotorula toruloides TaxID=5286 RepID=A0A061BLW2_RHOTO|nr:RHTO0S21e02366g1_1 [Rhodotorula toruloides]